jgi:hypothetical protein
MSDNTALIQDLFGSIAQEGWSTKFNDALADDLVWVATGSSPVAETYKGKRCTWKRSLSVWVTACSRGPSLWWRTFSWTETLHAFSSMAKAEWVKMVPTSTWIIAGGYDSVKMTALFRD